MKAVKKQRLPEMVAEELVQYIRSNNLSAGEKLPSIDTMARTFEVGRSTLREALQILEAREVVFIENGKGTFVQKVAPFLIQTRFQIENETSFLLDALDVREALEGKAVQLATMKATDQQVAELSACLTVYRQSIRENRRDEANQADAKFHHLIYHIADNSLLESMIDSMAVQFDKFWDEPFGKSDIFDSSYPYHETLLDAIRASDQEKAVSAFHQIIESVRSSILAVSEEKIETIE
ncbi:FadR/GntR family transcriptional regulator [Aureibacillus halotolerans]|uniref:GntR family transcriptional regulator n=1 Tax=Aureibacillus halotolerans TaxID=1508390 RepID=A0A4R6UA31_9BACI|nr:FadR/GntR family transcriptional regulator [Aureibacillus halotolerans]TDQ42686.1 GntR family transcriptional regulator [Aureibacillus halotolerans]